jgi:ERCC4-related helicase
MDLNDISLDKMLKQLQQLPKDSIEFEFLKNKTKPLVMKTLNATLIKTYKNIVTSTASNTKQSIKPNVSSLLEQVNQMDIEIQRSKAMNSELQRNKIELNANNRKMQETNSKLGYANTVVKSLEKKDRNDRIILFVSVAMFLLTVLYIFLKRI